MDGIRPGGTQHTAQHTAQHTTQAMRQGNKPRHLQRRTPSSPSPSPSTYHSQQYQQARSAAAEVFDRMRSLVDNVSASLDGPQPTARDRLVDNWTRIQDYYARDDTARKQQQQQQQISDTTIPHHLEQMLHVLAREMLETADAQAGEGAGGSEQPLEFGPCVEYLLQYHVLSDLADLADGDRPHGMRAHVVRFFCLFIEGIPLGLLPESAIRLPLVAVMRQSLRVVQGSATTAVNPLRRAEPSGAPRGASDGRLGRGYHSVLNDAAAVVLCHDLLLLIVVVFRRLREHAAMVYLFFDWDSARPAAAKPSSGGGGGELAVAALRSATAGYLAQAARGHELFIVHVVVEYLLAPGLTGQLAREALVLVAQVLLAPADKARHVGFLLEQARVVELLVEHMGYLHAQLPVIRPMPRAPGVRLFGAAYAGARGRVPPLQRRLTQTQHGEPAPAADIRRRLQRQLATAGQLRSTAQQEQRDSAILASARHMLEPVDAFFLCWELLDEIAFAAHGDSRVCAAVHSQLTNGFLRTHVAPALQLASMDGAKNQAITTVSYLTDLINVTASTCVLDAMFAVLLGGDLAPEMPPAADAAADDKHQLQQPGAGRSAHVSMDMFSPEDRELLESIEDDAMRAEAAALLLPPGFDASLALVDADGAASTQPQAQPQASSVRATLIGWMTLDDGTHLSLNTLRLFDTILSTLNQFAYASLVLRNFVEPTQEDEDEEQHGGAGHVPALGRGESVAADQELARAVVERFLDAAPSSVAAAMPESVVAAALRLEQGAQDAAPLSPPGRRAAMRPLMQLREAHGCDEYVADSLRRLRACRAHVAATWQPLATFVRRHGAGPLALDSAVESPYPGAFVASLVAQLGTVVRRHMAYNLMLTSMVNKLTCLGHPPLTAFLFLANSATLPGADARYFLYDALVAAAADAYVKSERVPRFAARLARQHREGVEAAVRVGAASGVPVVSKPADDEHDDTPLAEISRRLSSISTASAARQQQKQQQQKQHQQQQQEHVHSHPDGSMDVDAAADSSAAKEKNRADVARAVAFLGTPIKRFVHGYIVLDEFAKEMAGAALAMHTLELDRAGEGVRVGAPVAAAAAAEEYADLLEYYDPAEPAYRKAVVLRESLRDEGIIDLRRLR